MNKLNATMSAMIKFQQKQQMMDYHQQLRQMMMRGGGDYTRNEALRVRYNEIVRVGDAVINRHTKKIARVIRKDEVNSGPQAFFGQPSTITVYVLQYPDNTIHRWGLYDMAQCWSLCQPPAMEEAMLPEELR